MESLFITKEYPTVLTINLSFSISLRQRGDLILEDFDQYFFEKLHDQAQLLFKNNFNEVAWILENQWKGEWYVIYPI